MSRRPTAPDTPGSYSTGRLARYATLTFIRTQLRRPTRAISARRQPASFPPLAVVLAVAAGAMGAACFAELGRVFAGVMTGNLPLLGLASSTRSESLASHVAVMLLGYVTGTALGAFVARHARGGRRPAPVISVLLVELTVLAGSRVAGPSPATTQPALRSSACSRPPR